MGQLRQLVPAGTEPAWKRPYPWEDNPFRISLEGGYSLVLGSDSDVLEGGGAFGFSVSYEFYRWDAFFLAGDFSFLRSMHSGKGTLTGVTQNVNPTMIGLRGGYRTGRHEISLTLQTGALIMDASGVRPGGRSNTIWGLQYSASYAFGITSLLSVGPELRFTNGIDAGQYSTWFDMLAKVSFHF